MPRQSRSFLQTDSQATDKEEVQHLKSIDLRFLTFTDFDQSTNRETKKRVRSHAMTVVQRNIKLRRWVERNIVLDTAPLSEWHPDRQEDPPDLSLFQSGVPNLSDLGAGRSDPFTSFPIEMDSRSHELFYQLCREECPALKTLNKIGFFREVLSDEAAFRQVLCTSSSHLERFRNRNKNPEAIVLSTKAIRSVHRRLLDPELCTTDGIIIAILTFALHAVIFDDRQSVITHFNGLEEIIRRRGGLDTLICKPVLRTALLWCDVKSAFINDHAPRFPIPVDMLPEPDHLPSTLVLDRTLLDACYTGDMISAINELFGLIHLMASRRTTGGLKRDEVLLVARLVHKLLSTRHDSTIINPKALMEEACRIGILLYLAGILHGFGLHLSWDIYILKLKQTIKHQHNLDLMKTKPIHLWLLIMGGIHAYKYEDRNWFASEVADRFVQLKYRSWDEMMTTVRKISWIEGAFQAECDQLQAEVLSVLESSYNLFKR
ncbi:hypothetical protein F5884DRAFT_863069 [Xylogone sp. PMI_703]|nr:hypothetical protein F5884DRAFT_863069 [Xylogone sp. PMI_703]